MPQFTQASATHITEKETHAHTLIEAFSDTYPLIETLMRAPGNIDPQRKGDRYMRFSDMEQIDLWCSEDVAIDNVYMTVRIVGDQRLRDRVEILETHRRDQRTGEVLAVLGNWNDIINP